jgi:hypothetical protein
MLGLLGAATAFFYGGIIGVGQGYRAGGLANRWAGGVVMVASRLASRPSGRPVGPMGGRQAGGGCRSAWTLFRLGLCQRAAGCSTGLPVTVTVVAVIHEVCQ